MRILHVPYSYYPDPAGGTEVYVEGLARWQRSAGYRPAIAAPSKEESRYEHAGTPVWRFPVSAHPDLKALYGDGDPAAAAAFGRVLDECQPDILHLHAVTSAISTRLVERAVKRNIPVILNYHTPTVSCSRGTLLRWGREICDGKLDRRSCTACTLQAHGMPRPFADFIGALPAAAVSTGARGRSGGVWTALRMPELIDIHIRSFRRLTQMVDRVVALCNWSRELLVANGVPAHKVTLCRQGISWPESGSDGQDRREFRLPLRAAFLGRFDETKGIHILVEALRSDATLPIHLDLFGIVQGEAGSRYAGDVQKIAGRDPRIRILGPLPSDEVVPRLRHYDFVVVPSQWLETGPLVVLEAFAAGTPVLGSNLGGIAELVTDGVDGMLVDLPSSPDSWAASLRRFCSDPDFLGSLTAGIRPPRHTRQTALEMASLYEDIVRRGVMSPGMAK